MAGGYYWGTYVVPELLAQPSDLAAWMELPDPPAKALATLRACTRMVLDASQGAYYDADPATGLATAEPAATALRTATLIQAAAWVTLGIDPYAGGATTARVKSSSRLGSAQVVYADGQQAADSRDRAARHLVSDAQHTLAQANLLGTGPWTFG